MRTVLPLVLATLAACRENDPNGECKRTTTVLASTDVVSITGQSAADVLSVAGGAYTGELRWFENLAQHANAGTSTPLTLELVYVGGEVRDIDAELVSPCYLDGPCGCDDTLEIEMTLKLASDDGALLDTIPVTLKSSPAEFSDPWLSQSFDPDAAPGGLQTTDLSLPKDATLREFSITAIFESGAASGELRVAVNMGGGVGVGPFAGFDAVREP